MNEFKTFDNGIELSYSNVNYNKDDDAYVTVRAERWNHPYSRYEGLDYIIPSGEIQNIDNLKKREVETFVNLIKEYEKEIFKLAKENSFIDEGDNLIDFDVHQEEPSNTKKLVLDYQEDSEANEVNEDSENDMEESKNLFDTLKKIFL